MTPSSSGRKYVVERHASNADKTLDLDADWRSGTLAWPLEPDIGFVRNLYSALPESAAPLISIQDIQLCSSTVRSLNKTCERERVRSRV